MEKNGIDFDIVKNISVIEKLKCLMLSDISKLYSNMASSSANESERREIVSDIIITAYLLSNRLGISPESIDGKILNKLKCEVLKESFLGSDKSALYKYLSQKSQDAK